MMKYSEGNTENIDDICLYPIDLSSILTTLNYKVDTKGTPYFISPIGYHPTTIAQYALVHWNRYLTTQNESDKRAFLIQVNWLVEHETRIGEDASGWLISFSHLDGHTSGSWLSVSAQSCGLSVLARAYRLTHDETLLKIMHRVVRTFERDVLDGGICAPIGVNGTFFEDVAVYPATHALGGFLFALLGLYDYVTLIADTESQLLIERSLIVMHSFLDEFDVGFWTYRDLLHRRLASPSQLALYTALLEALAEYSGSDYCSRLARRWKGYQSHRGSRLRYFIAHRRSSYGHALLRKVRTMLFPASVLSSPIPVCVTATSFPALGGIMTVLEGIEQVMKNIWHVEYLSQYIGPQSEKFVIHRFGSSKTSPWLFPFVLLYFVAGAWKLLSLLRKGADYRVILPQESIATSAFSVLVGKLAGIRVVSIDHGDMSVFIPRNSRIFHAELRDWITSKKRPWVMRLLLRYCVDLYQPSRFLLARLSAPRVDHFLIPGVVGDGVEEICKKLGISPSRITRFTSMVDVSRHVVPDPLTKAATRKKKGIPADAIVVAIICRLSPEKSLDIALESISRALSVMAPELRTRVRVVIAGDGPLRTHIEEEILARGLNQTCVLWGALSTPEVISLLGLSDIFLYTSMRGACFAMALLEAMASKCAVIASTEPPANEVLLDEGRGIAVPPGDVEQTSAALVRLFNDLELCHHMGDLARDYIATHHNAAIFRRTLQQATYWSALDDLVNRGTLREATAQE